ncbi:hypothetical protein CC86DRAFT_370639 [Ophiobolus disseminans]|uniref:Uncharacterized protein n=1 Tax=Ophiobolus disseminans TaxID=1469910 RepID=A0A6A6ZXD6_9PLEO|nr:hypothetical protein CC86DRAFT_370639 [Ophiobolus disseminans]
MGVGREVGYLVLDAFPLFFANDKTLHPNVVGKNTLWFDDNEDVPRMRCDLTQSGLDGLYPYVLMDLRRGFLLRRHASSIFSLHSSFQITCEPPPAVHTTTLVQFYNMLGVPPPPQLSPDQAPDSSDNEVRLHDLDLVKLHKDLIAAETAIVDQWLCDLFYFGSKAGVDVAAKIYPSDPRNWHCVLPNATHACWTYDSYRYQRQALSIRCTPQQLQAMRQLQEEIMQTFPKHEQALMMEKTLMYTRDAYWGLEASHPLFWQLHRVWNSHIKADPDAIPVAALDLGYADHIRRTCAATISTSPASVDDVIADWSSIVKRLRDSCRTYGPMSAALRDAHRSGFRPAFMVSNRMQDDEFDEFEDGIVSFLRPLSGGDIQINRKTVLSEAWIVVHAWAILENLQLQEDVSAEQNCNIMWIHIVTLDMMVQLRGLLHHRRIVKCLDDAAKNVERIVLI